MTTFLLVDIPLFREILLCSFRCEHCGESNNEVQFAGRLPDLGVEILFRCLQAEDLNREIVRSEYSTLYIEELDLELPSKKAEITNLEALLKRTY
jgi:zinc finger protein